MAQGDPSADLRFSGFRPGVSRCVAACLLPCCQCSAVLMAPCMLTCNGYTALCSIGVIVFALTLHLFKHPYEEAHLNNVDTMALFASFVRSL